MGLVRRAHTNRHARVQPRRHRAAAVIVLVVLVVAAAMGVGVAVTGGFGQGGTGAEVDTQVGSDAAQSEPSAEELLAQKVDEKINTMTLEQKVAQLFVVRPEALTDVSVAVAAGDATKRGLEQVPVGGIVYFADNLQDPDQTRQMLSNTQAFAQEVNGLPIFLCVDEEGGTVSRVGGNPGFAIANVGNMCDIGAAGDPDQARAVTQHIGDYLTNLGFNVDFAPDADIASNPDGEMGLRAFGTTADAVAPMVSAAVQGFEDADILCAAKHFPGIGGAAGDSHGTKIYSQKTADEMVQEELKPFEAAIDEDVPFIMVGHLSCPAITGDDDPASISSEIVTDLLRNRLGYQGIIITDSMGMGAVTSSLADDRLAAEALKAGVDMVLMPADLDAAYQGVLSAVQSGELTEQRIDESVKRILTVKLGRLGDVSDQTE